MNYLTLFSNIGDIEQEMYFKELSNCRFIFSSYLKYDIACEDGFYPIWENTSFWYYFGMYFGKIQNTSFFRQKLYAR